MEPDLSFQALPRSCVRHERPRPEATTIFFASRHLEARMMRFRVTVRAENNAFLDLLPDFRLASIG